MAKIEYIIVLSDKMKMYVSTNFKIDNNDGNNIPRISKVIDTLSSDIYPINILKYLYYYNPNKGFVPIAYSEDMIKNKINLYECLTFKKPFYIPYGTENRLHDNFNSILDMINNEKAHQLSNKTISTKNLEKYLNKIDDKIYYWNNIQNKDFANAIKEFLSGYINSSIQLLRNERVKRTKEKQEQKVKDYNEKQAKEREKRLMNEYKTRQEQSKIYYDTTKQLDKFDWQFVPELTEKRFNLNQKPKTTRKKPVKTKDQETFKILQSLKGCPYRSDFKLEGLYYDNPQKLIEAIKQVKPLNNFNIKENKKKYHLMVCSKVKYTFIGDIFFQSNHFAYLLLINVNTRKAFYYPLGKNYEPIQEIIDADTGEVIKTFNTTDEPKKDVDSMIKAFDEIQKETKINILEFDGEKSISSTRFQNYLKRNNILFKPLKPGSHTSTGLMDRLCKTIRDIAFNMGADTIDNNLMNKIIKIYNSAPHKTLTQILNTNIKSKYGISPNDVENNEDLETLFVETCLKYNALIKSQDDYLLKLGDKVRIYNKNLSDKLFEGTANKTNKRSVLSKDIYIVKGYEGNLIKLEGPNEKIIYKPRRDLQKI